MTVMRAKLKITSIQKFEHQETLHMSAISKPTAYDDDGLDEDNTYAKFTPSANLTIIVANPALFDKFKVGEAYYLDFTKAE